MGMQTMYPNPKEQRQAENQTVVSKTASATLQIHETVVKGTIPATGSITLTLPPVDAAKNLEFFIWCGTDSGGTSIIIQDQDDGAVGSDFYAQLFNAGDAVLVRNVQGKYWMVEGTLSDLRVAKIPLSASGDTTVGGVFSWQNLTGVPVLAEWLVLEILDAAAEVVTVDAGVDDANDTSSDILIDGGALNALAVLNNRANGGTNGKPGQVVPSTYYVNGTASGSFSSLGGYAYIVYRPLI